MNENVRIRRMTLEDVDAVHSIEQATIAMPWSRQSFVSEMTTNRCARYLVAERESIRLAMERERQRTTPATANPTDDGATRAATGTDGPPMAPGSRAMRRQPAISFAEACTGQ